MRPTSKPPFCPPLHPGQSSDHPVTRPSLVPHQQGHGTGSLSWTTPWAAAGLPEPGWWKAFVVDRNLVLTRTPDHPGRKSQQEPAQKEIALNRPSRTAEHHPSGSSKRSGSPAVEQPLSPPQPRPTPGVHGQLAKIQSEFGAEPERNAGLDVAPEAIPAPTTGPVTTTPSTEAPHLIDVETAASPRDEAVPSEEVLSRLQTAFWAAPAAVTFSWQASASPVQPAAWGGPFAPTIPDAMAHDRTDTAHAKAVDGLEDAEFFEPEEPSTEAEATGAALTDIEATDLDLGYLALCGRASLCR